VLQFSYFPYAAAFIPAEGETAPAIDAGLVAIALAVAPLVFVTVGFVSRNPKTPKRILISMGLLLAIGLSVGLIAPILGAAAGFGVGIALTLNLPDIEGQMRRRMIGIAFAVAYMLLMLFVLTPAGVLAGAFLPGLMVGFADEYGAWRHQRQTSE
jgi:hypothetical protein